MTLRLETVTETYELKLLKLTSALGLIPILELNNC